MIHSGICCPKTHSQKYFSINDIKIENPIIYLMLYYQSTKEKNHLPLYLNLFGHPKSSLIAHAILQQQHKNTKEEKTEIEHDLISRKTCSITKSCTKVHFNAVS